MVEEEKEGWVIPVAFILSRPVVSPLLHINVLHLEVVINLGSSSTAGPPTVTRWLTGPIP